MTRSRLVILLTLLSMFEYIVVNAERVEPRLLSNVAIVDYEGPVTMEMLRLFGGAQLLEFTDCNLTGCAAGLLSQSPNLKQIRLYNVALSNIDPEIARGATSIEEFIYVDGSWENSILQDWNGYANLKTLIIDGHKQPFAELPENSFNNTKLQYLQISGSGVESIDDLAFNNLIYLETLKLGNNKLTTISKEALTPLRSLKELDLRRNPLTSFSIYQLPPLTNLETIKLSPNALMATSEYEQKPSAEV